MPNTTTKEELLQDLEQLLELAMQLGASASEVGIRPSAEGFDNALAVEKRYLEAKETFAKKLERVK